MPVRKIPKNYRHITGLVVTPKAIGEAGFEGRLEQSFLRLLRFDPSIAYLEVQPARIFWHDSDGKRRRYTPDFRIAYVDSRRKPLLLEIKPREILREIWQEFRPAFRAAVHCACMEGR